MHISDERFNKFEILSLFKLVEHVVEVLGLILNYFILRTPISSSHFALHIVYQLVHLLVFNFLFILFKGISHHLPDAILLFQLHIEGLYGMLDVVHVNIGTVLVQQLGHALHNFHHLLS